MHEKETHIYIKCFELPSRATKHNRLKSGESLSNDQRAVGFELAARGLYESN